MPCLAESLKKAFERPEVKEKLSKRSTGGNNSHAKKVKVTNIITNEETIFGCIKDLILTLNIKRSVFDNCILGKIESVNNLKFEFVDKND